MNMQTEAAAYAARLSNIAHDLDQGAMPDGLDILTIRKAVDLLRRWPDEDARASAPDGSPTGVARSIAPGEPCQFEGCNQPATRVAMGRGYFDATEEDPDKDDGLAIDPDWGDSELRHPGLGAYCEDHAVQVAAEHPNGWHITNCRNCGCRAGH